MADRWQIGLLALYLDALVQVSEEAIFQDPFELLDTEEPVQGFAGDEVQMRELFVVAGSLQQGITDDPDHPRNYGERNSESEPYNQVIGNHWSGVVRDFNMSIEQEASVEGYTYCLRAVSKGRR